MNLFNACLLILLVPFATFAQSADMAYCAHLAQIARRYLALELKENKGELRWAITQCTKGDPNAGAASLEHRLRAANITVPDRRTAIAAQIESNLRPTADHPFDGIWQVSGTCEPAGSAQGYNVGYRMVVGKGAVHGEFGEKGAPGFTSLSGQILPDGTGTITVEGLTGDAKYNAGNAAAGVRYSYPITVRFTAAGQGTGQRDQGRRCHFAYARI